MPESIDDLRHRWEEDPSPQLSLHLAEEYRRLDRREEAVYVLGRALEEHPEHVAARVALGRYRLELGDVDEARQILEQVVAEDPTHLVANKLLVGLYMDIGRDKQAQDRLDLYKLLNAGDEEIEFLERRLRGEESAPEPRFEEPDPFVGLWEAVGDTAYWQAVGAEGIFPVIAELSRAIETARSSTIAIAVEAPAPAGGATVTLANLYLQQGHLDDAEQAYREVLDREPDNQDAVAGLEDILQRRSRATAGEEMPSFEIGAVATDPTARKISMLREYLERIRSAAGQ